MKRLAAAFAATLLFGSPALACSICRCGDATFNALGTDVYTAGRFRLALDWDRFDKENGTSEEAATAGPRRAFDSAITGRDEEVENRFTATLSYSFGEKVTAVARVPWSSRRLTTTDLAEGTSATVRTRDLSDPEVYGLVKLWAAPLAPGLGRRAWLSLVAGVKTPWGRNDITEDGVRVDEHAQAGTGSTDVFAGLSFVVLLDPASSIFTSAQYRRTGTNDFDYRYGNITLANLAYEHKIGTAADGVVELNYRHAQKDRVNAAGDVDPNTGGDVLYLTPRVILDIGRGLLARATVQIPVVRSLYGDQTERFVASAGFTYLF
jgi:hypothetical protein